jgi:hypothetical protein
MKRLEYKYLHLGIRPSENYKAKKKSKNIK